MKTVRSKTQKNRNVGVLSSVYVIALVTIRTVENDYPKNVENRTFVTWTASLRWQHQPILRPPCRSGRRRFRGDLNLSRRFIRPHSPDIDFGSDGPTFNPLLLHLPFLSFFPLSSPPRVVSYSRLFPLTRLFPLLFITVTRYSRRCVLANIELRTSRKRYQTARLIRSTVGLKGSLRKGQGTICDRTLEKERSGTKSLARVHSDGIAGAICSGRNSVI